MWFSVIIPLYNKAPYVGRALDSVLAQSFADYELRVVDDGSTDGSAEEVKRRMKTDARLVRLQGEQRFAFIQKTHAGVSAARNAGIAQAKGTFLCFLDADDAWEPDFLAEMAACIKAHPRAHLYASNYFYVKNGRSRRGVQGVDTGPLPYFETYLQQLQAGGGMPVWTGAVVLRRALCLRLGGFKPQLHLGEDFDLWVRVALQGPPVFLNKPLARYHQDVGPRAIGRLHAPAHHFLWHLEHLAGEEARNPACKRLLDRLRATGLLPYYLHAPTRAAACAELAKIDWTAQAPALHRPYLRPRPWVKALRRLRWLGARAKQMILKYV